MRGQDNVGRDARAISGGDRKPQAKGRKQERPKLSIPLRIVSHGALEQQRARGVCVDLSEAGVGFLTDADLNLTDIVELIPESRQTTFHKYVRLVYRIGRRYGGYFSHLE